MFAGQARVYALQCFVPWWMLPRLQNPSRLLVSQHALLNLVPQVHAAHLRSSCQIHMGQVVEAGAGAPWLLGASLPPGMTGSEVRGL